MVMAAPESLDRIFNNLLSNAVKYTPREGKVTVTLLRSGEDARILIEDTGIGIPEEAVEHLFEEFYRAPNAKEFEREGTGLGLTIAKDLVTRLGGWITVHSTQGEGTRFTVSLPLVEEKHPSSLSI
jgi:signal transduction histidine kinase